MNYIYELKMKVRDYECDLQGIVNNANYQHYLEHTRHEFLLSTGVSFAALHEQGVDPVVARINIDISVIESLDPDKIYFIPIAIADATPYPIVKKKGNALLQIQKKNKYTSSAEPASYNASGYEGSGYFVITKTMVPLTKNRVRINIGTKRLPAEPENQPDFIKKNTIVIEVADDNSLTVEPYDPEEMEVETVDVKVAHPGDNAYALYNNRLDPTTTTFCVCYKYRLKTGSWTEVREAIRLPVIVIE